jgi:hypothetical protein
MKMIPEQQKGAKSVTRYSVTLSSEASARQLFENAKKNLLNVNAWHDIAGSRSAVFEIIDNRGNKISNDVKKGNYLRITIPVIPGSPAGAGADWVKVENIAQEEKENYECVALSVRPAPAPINNEPEVAHFFAPGATSTFSVERRGRAVIASVNGRNETPNTKTKNLLAWMRNLIVALGAMMGLNKPQWKSLVKGLIKKRL